MAQIGISSKGMKNIAASLTPPYTGDMRKFPEYLRSSASGRLLLKRVEKAARGMVIQAAEGALVKVGKYWHTENADGTTTNTQHRNQSQAQIVADAQATIANSTAKSTGQMVDTGKFWSVVMDDGTLVNTGKTKIKHAESFVGGIEQKTPESAAPVEADPVEADPVEAAPVADPVAEDAGVAPVEADPAAVYNPPAPIGEAMVDRAFNPNLQGDQKVDATKIEVTDDQLIKEGTGALTGTGAQATATEGTVTDTAAPVQPKTATVDPTLVGDTLPKATAVKGTVAPKAVIDPREQTETALTDMKAVQGTAQTVKDAPVRTVQEGEMDVGSTVDMDKVQDTFGTGEVQAASIKDELTTLMDEFDGGSTPAWAAGGMRKAMASMSARGLSASSMAGQAVMQAAMESALPIAQIEAGNKQQMNMFKAEQRAKFLQIDFDQSFQAKVIKATKISDIANMNFNAEQQVAIENARLAQTMDLANLDSRKSMQMAQAAQISQLELTNLNNRQQAEVMNAQNFLAMDMANLDREQATEVFNTQNRVQSMFNDQAASNAAKQFNASSENQTNQFFAGLKTQVDMQNAAQKTAMSQFNAGQKNAASQFNASVQNQRDQFNAQNQMVIAQGNVQWRRAVATGDTAAINRANELNANALLNMSSQAYQNLWQEHADTMERSWKTGENAQDRINQLAVISMQGEIELLKADKESKSNNLGAIGNLVGTILTL